MGRHHGLMVVNRIDPESLRPETRAAIVVLANELAKEPMVIHGVQITLDNLRGMDAPPTIDVKVN